MDVKEFVDILSSYEQIAYKDSGNHHLFVNPFTGLSIELNKKELCVIINKNDTERTVNIDDIEKICVDSEGKFIMIAKEVF